MNMMRQNRHILLIDDEPDILQILEMILENKTTQISIANNAEKGFQIVKNNPSIDLVISDIRMPGRYDGIELFEILKREFPMLPVILMTGESTLSREKALKKGVAGYLEKPIDFDRLQFLIDSSIRFYPKPIRQFIRVSSELPTRLIFHRDDQIIEGITRNISQGGIFFETEGNYQSGSKLQFEIDCLNIISPSTIKGEGLIVWSGKRSDIQGVGIEFSYLPVQHELLVNSIVEEFNK